MLYEADVGVCSEIIKKTNKYSVDRMRNSLVLNLLVFTTGGI